MTDKDLVSFVESTNSKSHLRVEADLGDGFFRLRTDEAERRQAAQDIRCTEDIIIEMLRNARDAHARNIFLASSKENDTRLITIIDDGDGIPASMHQAIFEPRVTSKLDTAHFDKWGMHGRGMALYSIASNATHAAVCLSEKEIGASFRVEVDCMTLSEKTDQSSFPRFEFTENGTVAVRGPKNILRTVAEFALEHRKAINVYIGSPAEIAATLYHYGIATTSASLRAFSSNSASTPLVKRLACSSDPTDFKDNAQTIGLDFSERTARRIMDGSISALPSVMERIEKEGFPKGRQTVQQPLKADTRKKTTPEPRDFRGLKLSADDLSEFSDAVAAAYRHLAQSYYLDPTLEPIVHIDSRAIRITIPVRNDDV